MKKPRSQGLGDSIALFTKATGVDRAVKIVKALTGFDCGCQRRREKLNKQFPYRQ